MTVPASRGNSLTAASRLVAPAATSSRTWSWPRARARPSAPASRPVPGRTSCRAAAPPRPAACADAALRLLLSCFQRRDAASVRARDGRPGFRAILLSHTIDRTAHPTSTDRWTAERNGQGPLHEPDEPASSAEPKTSATPPRRSRNPDTTAATPDSRAAVARGRHLASRIPCYRSLKTTGREMARPLTSLRLRRTARKGTFLRRHIQL